MIFDTGLFSFWKSVGRPEPVLCDFCKLKEYLLDDVFAIDFTVEVNIELNCDFTMLEDSRQSFEDKVYESVSWFFLLQYFYDVFFKKTLDLAETIVEPVLGETGHKIVDMFKRVLVAIK